MVECISIQEKIEQVLIDKSVTINLNDCSVSVYLPFICDPVKRLKTNYHIAEKNYSQARKLNSKPKDKEDLIKGSPE